MLHGAGVGGDALRLAGTGLIGAYTTFSTWMLESHRLGEDGRPRLGVGQRARQPGARARRAYGWETGSGAAL